MTDIAPAPAPAILVVDDNAAKRMAVRAMLAPLGYGVIEVDSGREALRAVLRQRFAMILMDVRMPTLDGYETAKLIRQRPQSELTPIIFVTAFGCDEAETATAYASGAVDFIFTPILPDVLRAKVSAFVSLFLQSEELQRSLESITTLNAALRASEVRARAVLQNVADGIVTAGEGGLIESFNRSARTLFGYREQEVIGQPLQFIVAPSHHDEFSDSARAKWSLLDAGHIPAESNETVGCRKDGTCFPMEIDISQMEIGERTFTIACVRNISGRKAYTEALEHRTLHDELTGLPNRTLFADRVDSAIAFAARADEAAGVLLVDLDKFGKVNDVLGRETGDALLQAVAGRLRGAMRDADTVGHLDGDSFGILPSGETDVEAAAAIAWKIREVFDHPFLIAGHSVAVRASIGIALFPEHGDSASELLRRAELALREAKSSGEGLAVFVADPADQAARRLTLLNELRVGIPRGELVLHYQPKVDLRAGRRTTGVEALVRWQHPSEGLLMPAQFMPEAERSELIEPLTKWVLNEALRQQRMWCDAGFDLTMAVNVSARSLTRHSDLPDTVAELTETWGIPPGRLILELTENAIIDDDVAQVLDVLHAMGEGLSIDDFGTGHSSLAYLQQLTIDEIKIDRSFVMNLPSVVDDATIVRSTIELAHNLGLTVVAEGVEDEAALEILVEDGCDLAQGYFFSRPCPAGHLTTWLTESPFGAQLQISR
ncbi:MAG TPA: EAL domain-containing protein [Solirubrobacteraceae bacterium]|jgi:diguanylate cyclase (GGDEF)-like protein/PAS domain S-box-containing protein|nr:EAL domain-containing protein [Solirubrobacteraceae bacterium]